MKLLSGITFLGLLSVAVAQHPEDLAGSSQPAETVSPWHEFLDRHGPDWQIERSPATGTPKAIYGPGLKLGAAVETLESARVQAQALLLQQGKLLGRGGSDFVEVIGAKANRVYVFVYDQTYRGLDVIGGRADVRIHDVGVVSMFGATAVPIPPGFSIRPRISAAAARGVGERKVLGGPSLAEGPAPRLVIWADTESRAKAQPVLAFEVQIDNRPMTTEVGKAYVDAGTGALLHFANEVFECACGKPHVVAAGAPRRPSDAHADRLARCLDRAHAAAPHLTEGVGEAPPLVLTGRVMAWTNKGSTPTAGLTNVPVPNLQVVSLVGSTYTDSNGRFSITYTGNTTQFVGVNLVGRHSKRVRVAAGSLLKKTVSMKAGQFQTIQLGSSTMGQLDRSQTTTYWFTNDCNTWFRSLGMPTTQMNQLSTMDPLVNIAASCNAYYTAFTINFYQESTICNMTAYETVIQHEWGHGADHAFGGISQVDGLSEGWGDILATFRSGQPIVGPNFRKNGNFVRTALNKLTFPAGGGVHQKGQTWMGFAWGRANQFDGVSGSRNGSRTRHINRGQVDDGRRDQPAGCRARSLSSRRR